MPKHTKSRLPSQSTSRPVLNLNARPIVGQFLLSASTGTDIRTGEKKREFACFGARGDGKTIGALLAMVAHAQKHQAAGYPLPVQWIGVTDTFQSHKLKTVRSLQNPFWQGIWEVRDQGHVAECVLNGQVLVHLDLFGIEDQGARDRVRMETCGVWFEEAAPTALMVQSAGIDRDSWALAITSQRIPSHANPAILTENYPDEDHWTWQRFVVNKAPGTSYFRVPPGERADASQRQEWQDQLKDRPDLARRLLDGQPGVVLLGSQVAQGFNEDRHVSPERVVPISGEPLFIGQDFGHTPTTIIGQLWRGYVHILAALTIERGGIKQHVENNLRPWLQSNAPWAMRNEYSIIGDYDPAAADEETDIEQNPAELLRKLIPGVWQPGPVDWESRKGPMLAVMNKSVGGVPALRIDPLYGKDLVRALSGRWYYKQDRSGGVIRDIPAKPNHPWEDYGDAFCYMLCAMGVSQGVSYKPTPIEVHRSFNAREQLGVLNVKSQFDARRFR